MEGRSKAGQKPIYLKPESEKLLSLSVIYVHKPCTFRTTIPSPPNNYVSSY